MTEAELLKKIKNGLGIYTNFQDDTLKEYISEVQEYMRGAGVSEDVLNSAASESTSPSRSITVASSIM